jgi:hypothetical protein
MNRALKIRTKRQPTAMWQTAGARSIVGYELELAEENSKLPGFEPEPAFKLITECSGGRKLLRALDKLAPALPLVAYDGLASVHLAPPLSGAGNVIYVVAGKDSTGSFRVAGGNHFSDSAPHLRHAFEVVDFFDRLDTFGGRDACELIAAAIWHGVREHDEALRQKVSEESRKFGTMPIFLSVILGCEIAHFAFPALIDGDHPSDMSLEWVGEVE